MAIRVLGEINKSQMDILREADDIMIHEIQAAGVYRDIGQAFCVLLPVKSVGVMGDGRTYEQACAIRCVQTTDFMTADWYHMDYNLLGKISSRIINEVYSKKIKKTILNLQSSRMPYLLHYLCLLKTFARKVRGINRVCYDISSKPPATIEWE